MKMLNTCKENIRKDKRFFSIVFIASLVVFTFLMNIVSIYGLVLYREILIADSLGIDSVIFLILFCFLLSVSITLYKNNLSNKIGKSKFSFAGVFAGLFTSGCSICPPLVLSLIGVPSAAAIFPFGGYEIKALSLILLLASIYMLSKNMDNVCKK